MVRNKTFQIFVREAAKLNITAATFIVSSQLTSNQTVKLDSV
jgi:hypothetical protein